MLIVCGYSGCGKSTLARTYADQLGCVVRDTDAVLEAKFGRPVRDLYIEWGETRFREEEGAVLELMPHRIDVLATGGGTLCREANGRLLQELGTLVYLYVPPNVLWERLCRRTVPPSFVAAGYEAFALHFAQRSALYARWCEASFPWETA